MYLVQELNYLNAYLKLFLEYVQQSCAFCLVKMLFFSMIYALREHSSHRLANHA